jgi:hypothetical protein
VRKTIILPDDNIKGEIKNLILRLNYKNPVLVIDNNVKHMVEGLNFKTININDLLRFSMDDFINVYDWLYKNLNYFHLGKIFYDLFTRIDIDTPLKKAKQICEEIPEVIFCNHFFRTNKWNINFVGEEIQEESYDSSYKLILDEKSILPYFKKKHPAFITALLRAKILHSSFFLSELVTVAPNIFNKYIIKKDMFFEDFSQYINIAERLGLTIPQLGEKKESFLETFKNLYKEKPEIEIDFEVFLDLKYYHKVIYNKEINASYIYFQTLKVEPQKTFTRELTLQHQYNGDAYTAYMMDVLQIKHKGFSSSVLEMFKKSIIENNLEDCSFYNKLGISFNEDLKKFVESLIIKDSKFYYNNCVLVFYLSENNLNNIKTILREENINEFWSYDLITQKLQKIKLNQVKEKNILNVQY